MHSQPISSITGAQTASMGGRSSTTHQKTAGHSARVASGDLSGRSGVSSDEKDSGRGLNVTVLEEYLYALMHPGGALYLDQLTQYNSRGDLVTRVRWMPRLIDIRV